LKGFLYLDVLVHVIALYVINFLKIQRVNNLCKMINLGLAHCSSLKKRELSQLILVFIFSSLGKLI